MVLPVGLDGGVRAWVAEDFGVRLTEAERFGGGLDPDAAVWQATGDDERVWAVKWTRRDNRYGLRLARSLADDGVEGVPAPLLSRAGSPWSDREGGRLSVTAWIAGEDAFDAGLDAAGWRGFGALLRRVHDHRLADDGSAASERGAEPATARHGIRRAGTHVKRRLAEVDALISAVARAADASDRDPAPVTTDASDRDPALDAFLAGWPAARARIRRLRTEAGRLRRARTPTTRVSCHGDPHLGNVVVDEHGRPWLIDFDDAVEAPREVDLHLIELGVLFSLPISDEQRADFRRGYGTVALDDERVLRFGCVRAVEDLVETAHEILTGQEILPAGAATSRAELRELFDGILSKTGLAGLVERRLDGSRDEAGILRA